MNFVIAGIVVILIMLCTVAGFMLALIKKLEILESTLDVINFGVKDVISEANKIIREDISGIYGVLDKLLEIEKDFDSNISKSTNELVEVCKNHLCAIMDRCRVTEEMVVDCTASITGTAEAVKSLRESTDALENQVTAITDYIREKFVEKESLFDRGSLCDSCKYNNEEGFANVCCYCSERANDTAFCSYEPKNAFEQAGEV